MKKIIIFGATGETGLYLSDYLFTNLHDRYEIIAVGRRKTDYFTKFPVAYYAVDITKKETLEALPQEDVFAVIHLAGMLPARMSGYDPQQYIDVNITGSLNVLEYCRKVKADRFLYTKSVADLHGYLGKIGDVNFFRADLPRAFLYSGDHCIYAITKSMVQDMAEFYHQTYGIKAFTFRLPNIYMYSPAKFYYVDGKPQRISNRYMIDRAIAGEPIEVWGNPQKGCDMVYVKDFCRILYLAVIADCNGGEFNVGSGRITSLEEQVRTMIDVFSPRLHPSSIIYCPDKRDCVNILMDISKTSEDLGYFPQYSIRKLLVDYKEEMQSDRFHGIR